MFQNDSVEQGLPKNVITACTNTSKKWLIPPETINCSACIKQEEIRSDSRCDMRPCNYILCTDKYLEKICIPAVEMYLIISAEYAWKRFWFWLQVNRPIYNEDMRQEP